MPVINNAAINNSRDMRGDESQVEQREMEEAGEGLRDRDRFIESGLDSTVDHFLTTPH